MIFAQVDQLTGYRHYSDLNYEVAIAVKILKTYGLSVAEIKQILSECEDEIDMSTWFAQIGMRYLMMPVMSISIGYMAAYHKAS